MKENIFFKVLSFERYDKYKVAQFIDKFGQSAVVITDWDRVIPGLRYNCKLLCKYKEVEVDSGIEGYINWDVEKIRQYKMVNCKVWYDDLQIITGDNIVQIKLDNKVVPELDFDCINCTDVDQKVQDLQEYFKEKTFQLSTMKDIEKFVDFYKECCNALYEKYKKDQMKGSKKYVCKETIV